MTWELTAILGKKPNNFILTYRSHKCNIYLTKTFFSFQDVSYIKFHHQSVSYPSTLRSADTSQHVQLENPLVSESPRTNPASPRQDLTKTCMQYLCSGRAEPVRMVPARCRSPSRSRHKSEKADQVLGENITVSLCRSFLQEVHFNDSIQHKVGLKDYYPLYTISLKVVLWIIFSFPLL